MAYVHADNAVGPAASARPAGGATLTLAAGKGAAFAAASPSPASPMPVAIFRGPAGSEVLQGAVLVTGVSGDVLTCAGNVPGYVDPAVQAGDVAACVPLAADDAALWAAVATRVTTADLATALSPYALTSSLSAYVTTSALATALSPYATTASLSAYATTSALSAGLAAKQATLTAGSITTSLIADKGVTLAKLPDAAAASVLGAPAAGGRQDLPLGRGLGVASGSLVAKGLTLLAAWTSDPTTDLVAGELAGNDRNIPVGFVPAFVTLSARTNPSGGGFSFNLSVGGTNLFGSAQSYGGNTTAVSVVSSGFAPSTLPAASKATCTVTLANAGVRGVSIELWGYEA